MPANRIPLGKPDWQQARVVGGEESPEGMWPAMAALLYAQEDESYLAQFCGGTLIDPSYVLTAAHCVEGLEPEDIQVAVGFSSLSDIGATDRIQVVEIIRFPDYNPIGVDNDVALLMLESPVTEVAPMPWASDDRHTEAGTLGMGIGWGLTDVSDSQSYASKLMQVALPVVDPLVANGPLAWDGDLPDSHFAAGFAEGGKDTCVGDSGGPFLVEDANTGIWYVAGITSFGMGGRDCGDPDNYGAYTDVAQISDWITDQVYPDSLPLDFLDLGADFPAIEAWLLEHGQDLAQPDADQDGFPLPLEYALGLNPASVDQPLKTIRVGDVDGDVRVALELDFLKSCMLQGSLEYSSNLDDWQEVAGATVELAPEDEGLMRKMIFESPEPAADGFYRIRFDSVFLGGSSGRLLHLNEGIRLSLGNRDFTEHGRAVRYYRIPPTGVSQLTLVLRSMEQDASLILYNEELDSLLATDSQNSGGGDDDALYDVSVDPNAGYFVRVSSQDGDGLGAYTLALYSSLDYQDRISPGESLEGVLTSSSDADPLYPRRTFYKEDYLLDGLEPGDRIVVSLTSSSFSPSIELLNAETKEFLVDGADEVRFTVPSHAPVFVRVTTQNVMATGSYDLSVEFQDSLPRLTNNETLEGLSLDSSDPVDPNYEGTYYYDDYELAGYEDGEAVGIVMISDDFDTLDPVLMLIDGVTGEILMEVDDIDIGQGNYNARLEFTYDASKALVVRASSSYQSQEGIYSLSAF